MKKLFGILFILLLVCGITVVSFAQTTNTVSTAKSKASTEVIKGKIISVDTTKNEIVVKTDKTGVEETIVVGPKAAASLKADEEVKVTLNKGSNVAVSLKKIVKKTASTKK